VHAAWCERPVSHRGDAFAARFERVRDRLARLAGGASRVAIFCGSGTLANDVVAATLAADRTIGAGLILVNGEFGARLARQAARFGLVFRTLRQRWGRPWDLGAVADVLASSRRVGWVWGVHLETSTGTLNDLPGLRQVAGRAGVRLCLDAVSSLGALPLDLRGVHLASSSSGKALGAYAGLGIVFAAPDACAVPSARRIPTYLDLRAAMAARGPRFTVSSPLLAAVERALEPYDSPRECAERFAHYAGLGRTVRSSLRALGLRPVAEEEWAAPVVTSFTSPPGWTAQEFAATCRALGYEIAFASAYLRRRGWLQIATMGDLAEDELRPLFAGLGRQLAERNRRSRVANRVEA
jgi:aspartate aminotransferase-like enzyme